MKYKGIYSRYVKRALDILCALLAIIVFSWLYIILGILVAVFLGSPIVFTQERPGLIDPKTGKEKVFKLYKFRSMTNAKDENGNLLPDKDRLTKFGKILRATSLDELPEAWNILKGDMSVIGPRPLKVNYLDYYNDFEHRRHLVRPGLSGWAQVSGRNGISWKRKFELDNEYVDNISFLFDVKIIFLSVKGMIVHDGINFKQGHQPIMEYFKTHE